MNLFRRKFLLLGIFTYLMVIGFVVIHQVDKKLTPEDKSTILALQEKYQISTLPEKPTFEEQVDYILKIQKAVLAASPQSVGIPYGYPREPSDLMRLQQGLCYDRSRFIEKALELNGIEHRHIALYSTLNTGSKLKSLITRKPGSHSITEAKTKKGWLFIDSNDPWISLLASGEPVSISEIQEIENFDEIEWSPKIEGTMSDFYKFEFIHVFGLYSRHGKFYPPYNFFPDINWPDFLQNFY